ncbi:Tautomerase/MIF [Trametes meyenii]|nr:Tautomerase/MIF [Trametes meyenii]
MPVIDLKTNVVIADPKAFCLEFSKFSAKILKKDEAYFSVNYNYHENMMFKASFEPNFLLHVTVLDTLSPQANEEASKAFSAFLKEKLGLLDNRGYIIFSDPGRSNVG